MQTFAIIDGWDGTWCDSITAPTFALALKAYIAKHYGRPLSQLDMARYHYA